MLKKKDREGMALVDQAKLDQMRDVMDFSKVEFTNWMRV